MGIDAKMLVVVTGQEPTEAEVKLWSARLAREVGQEHFYQNRNTGNGALTLTEDYSDSESSPPGKSYWQDGPTLHAKAGETYLEVHLWTRYYGKGYERGNLMAICATAEWIEMNVPNSRVLYGSDSSGVCAEPFGEEERRELKRHAYSTYGRDYFKPYRAEDQEFFPTEMVAECKLCVPQYYQPVRYGFGKDWASYACAVCGLRRETRDAGKTWTEVKKESW